MPDTIPSGLSDVFAQDGVKRAQWAAFLKKNRLQPLELIEVDGRGLQLHITSQGSRLWRWAYRREGQQKRLAGHQDRCDRYGT